MRRTVLACFMGVTFVPRFAKADDISPQMIEMEARRVEAEKLAHLR